MVITWRVPVLVLLGIGVVLLRPQGSTVLFWLALVVVLVLADLLLAPSTRLKSAPTCADFPEPANKDGQDGIKSAIAAPRRQACRPARASPARLAKTMVPPSSTPNTASGMPQRRARAPSSPKAFPSAEVDTSPRRQEPCIDALIAVQVSSIQNDRRVALWLSLVRGRSLSKRRG